jgi:hypothetical protein
MAVNYESSLFFSTNKYLNDLNCLHVSSLNIFNYETIEELINSLLH